MPIRPRHVALALLLVAGLSVLAHAEPFVVAVPGQAWSIRFDTPPLTSFDGQSNGKEFQFDGAEAGGFNVSIFVEQPKGTEQTNEACFNYYWSLAKKNAKIDQASARFEKSGRFVKVSYQVAGGEGEKVQKSYNVNYYFVYKGRWVDVHVSKVVGGENDAQVFAAFERGLSYQPIPAQVVTP